MSEPLHLYAVHFVARGGTERVVILHASSEDDALYCISEGWGKPRKGAREQTSRASMIYRWA